MSELQLEESRVKEAKEARAQILDMESLNNPAAMKLYRRLDGILILVLFTFLTLGIQIQFTLTAGDWDYWVDWKDRRWWPLVTPLTLLMPIGAFTYGIWQRVRLPIMATALTTLLCLVAWGSHYLNFYKFTYFPLTFVFPATYIGVGILLDCALVMTRSLVVSAFIGAGLFGALVYPLNWPLIAAYRTAVEFNGTLLSLADLMGYEYIRTTTPEYLRIIESSTLRTFGGSVVPLTAVFAGFVSIVVYAIFLWVGSYVNKLVAFAKRIM